MQNTNSTLALGGDTPVLLPMGFQLGFFNVLRTVSYESSSSSTSNSTMRSANSLSVQRAYPSGDGPHANAISRASFAPSRRRCSGRGCYFFSRLASKPSSTSCSLARDTFRGLTSNASAIRASVHPGPSGPSSAFR